MNTEDMNNQNYNPNQGYPQYQGCASTQAYVPNQGYAPMPGQPVYPTQPQKKGKKGCLIAALVAAGLFVMSIVLIIIISLAAASDSSSGNSSVSVTESPSSKLRSAYSTYCSYSYADLATDGSYLSIDTNPNNKDDYSDSSAIGAIRNVNDYLGFPDSVIKQMNQTRAIDGRQSYTHGSYTVSWTYHPDSGLEVMYAVN